MRIVNRAEFITMPEGTLFSKYEPCFFEHIQIKGESIIFENGDDYMYQDIVDATDHDGTADMFEKYDRAEKEGASIGMDFNCQGRDGCFDKDQLFAVWEKRDVKALIRRLQKCIEGGSDE